MPYKLKPNQESFQSVDGPFDGRKFLSGQTYAEIPPEEAEKFEEINPVDPDLHRRTRNSTNTSNPINPEKEA